MTKNGDFKQIVKIDPKTKCGKFLRGAILSVNISEWKKYTHDTEFGPLKEKNNFIN